jgi:RNA polymerase sigma factor (sigma-70 family)
MEASMELYDSLKPLMIKYANKYAYKFESIEDYLQECYIVLVEAAASFDEEKSKFTTYFFQCLKWHCCQLEANSGIHIGRSLNEDIMAYKRFEADYIKVMRKEPTKEYILEKLRWTEAHLKDVLAAVHKLNVVYLDKTISESEETSVSLLDLLEDGSSFQDDIVKSVDHMKLIKVLKENIGKMEAINKDIVIGILKGLSNKEIAAELGILSNEVVKRKRKIFWYMRKDEILKAYYNEYIATRLYRAGSVWNSNTEQLAIMMVEKEEKLKL